MSSSGPSGDDYEEALAVFDERDDPTEPLTTPEVAGSLDTARRTVYNCLEELVRRGELKSKEAGTDARVWWRPRPDGEANGRSEAGITESTVRQLFESVPDPYLIVQPNDYEIVAVSDAYLEATMTERETILGQTLFEVFPADPADPDPEGVPQLRHSLRRVKELREEDVMPVTHYPVPDQDATEGAFEDRWWSPVNTPLFDSNGTLSYIIHHVQDVTPLVNTMLEDGTDPTEGLDVDESHLTADMLLKSQKLYEAREEAYKLAHQQQAVADLGKFALETDDLDALMNEAVRNVADVLDAEYCKVLDLDTDAEALLLRQGVGWDEGIVGDATVSAVEAESQAAYTLETNQPIVVEDLATETRFSGPALLTDHDVRSGISTVIGPFDNPWGILGVHDTEPREFSEEDVSFVVSVANILAEAIEHEQYESRLERLVGELEESNERLEQFAYAASHDLQEPLRMVSSYLQLIECRYGDNLNDEAQEFLDFAVDGADRMREMIDGLLQYSRVETEGVPLEPVALNDVIADVQQDLGVQISESNADIEVEELPRVMGDGSQLRHVFQNLLSNALQYSGDDSPRVHIAAERNGQEWLVSVEDEGVGIEPADQDRVFEVFQRLQPRDDSGGSGIGLALCDRIVERHGGDIWVESEPGEGATFLFTLPAVSDSTG
ncbi:PAS domain-containing sensor histidine kinase [Halovivax limisalsi]|uniref:PAS domain-containing sensor histidine kinase n=1 Tax=Halovivax limisalsi TaxID=1453760 RepID=UPI001FFD9092|nr:ATP-binding protein [Halovivax limisalsi]